MVIFKKAYIKKVFVILLCVALISPNFIFEAKADGEFPDIISVDVDFKGDVTIGKTLNLNGQTVVIEGTVTQEADIIFNGGKLLITGDFIHNNGRLDVEDGAMAVSGDYNQNGGTFLGGSGNVIIGGDYLEEGGVLSVGGCNLKVDGNYVLATITEDEHGNKNYSGSNASIIMNNPDGIFKVCKDFYFQSNLNNGANTLTDGTIELQGNFTQRAGYKDDTEIKVNFSSTNNNKVIFSGSKKQIVDFENPESSCFNILSKTDNTDVDIVSGCINKIGGNVTLNSFNQYGTMELGENTLTVNNDLNMNGNIKLNNGALYVKKNLNQKNGGMIVSAGSLFVSGNYTLADVSYDGENPIYSTADSYISMTDDNGYVLVGGDFYTMSRYNNGTNVLQNGTMEFKGDFTQKAGISNSEPVRYNFESKNNHKIIFSGNDVQNVEFEYPGCSGFGLFSSTNPKVNLNGVSILKIDGESVVNNFYQYGVLNLDDKTLNIKGNLVQFGNINVSTGNLNVNGLYNQLDGILNLNSGKVKTMGDYVLASIIENQDGSKNYEGSDGYIYIVNDDAVMEIGGDFITKSNKGNSNNTIYAGTIILKGDFYQYNGGENSNIEYNFEAKGKNKIIFDGTKTQNIVFESTTKSCTNIIGTSSNSDVNVTGAIASLEDDLVLSDFNQYGKLDLNGHKLTILGDLVENGSINLNSGELVVLGNYIHQGGCLTVGDGSITVKGDYRVQKMDTTGESVEYSSSEGYISMNNEAGNILIEGDFIIQSDKNNAFSIFSAGTIELKGDFCQYNGGINGTATYNFECSSNHVVKLTGEGTQNIYFEAVGKSKFNKLILAKKRYYNGEVVLMNNTFNAREVVLEYDNTSYLSDDEILLGNNITITGDNDGGNGDFTYEFYVKKSTEDEFKLIESSGNIVNYKPDAEGTYNVKVVVTDNGDNITREKEMSFNVIKETVDLKAPVVVGISTSDNNIKLSWTEVEGATGYQLYKYFASTKTMQKSKFVTTTSTTMYNVKPGSTYRYVVQPVAGDIALDNVNKDNVVDVTAGKALSSTPFVTATYNENKNYIELNWEKVSGYSTYYVYKYYTSSKTLQDKPKTVSNATSTKYYNIEKGKEYRYLVTTVPIENLSSYDGKHTISIKIPPV
ncbi:hypothetical protein SAMN02910289_00503 [Lachnospiraceae bacterium RM5]|nr:hypothetical protein SAMN02910289_00503 [Lachnospiraceae bacterium RM5]